jgi:hypothetical protein
MFAVISRMPEGMINPQSLIDFGRQETYDGDAYFRGQIGEMTTLLVPQGTNSEGFEAMAERILTRYPIVLAAYLAPAVSLVPYLQQGDLVVADRILPWPENDTSGPFGVILPEEEPACVLAETELVGGTFAAYELLYAGRSDRPQMIIGSVLSGRFPVVEKHVAAELHRQYGIIAGDRDCLAMATMAAGQDIRFLHMGIVSDSPEALNPAAIEPAMAVLRRFLQSRPVATVASIVSA